jgi:NTP pyrophosphatase (non-canonical NTP hydrolase)
MSFTEAMDRALAQARELQKQVAEAVNKTAEQLKPHVEKSLEDARELQATLSKHAEETGEVASKQAQVTLGYVNDYIKMGNEALRESAERTRDVAVKLVEQSRRVVDAAAAAAKSKEPE